MNITLRQLQAFIAVAETGNFTRAAERLHIAQSAVSVLVRELEAELAGRLFERTTRRVELTDVGRDFRGHAEKLLLDLDGAVRDARGLVERQRGRVSVAAPPLLAATLLPRAIAAFRRDFPRVRIGLRDLATDQIVDAVRSDAVDIGVGTFSEAEPGLARVPLFCDTLMVFSAARAASAAVRPASWRDLVGRPFIALTRQSEVRRLVDYGCGAAGLAIAPAFEVSQIATALALVEAGLGISVLPSYALTATGRRGICAQPLHEPSLTRDVVVIRKAGRSPQPALSDFLARLAAECPGGSLGRRDA